MYPPEVNGERKPRKMCVPESLHEKGFMICHAHCTPCFRSPRDKQEERDPRKQDPLAQSLHICKGKDTKLLSLSV